MQYLGGKSRLAKPIVKTIEQVLAPYGGAKGRVCIEPFMGGGAVTRELAGAFDRVFAYDIHSDLVLMWQALKEGWVPPNFVSEEEYKAAKSMLPSALRGFIGFGVSFGGKWFGGFARTVKGDNSRNYAETSSRIVLRDITKMQNVTFAQSDYKSIPVYPGAIVYCDPPYKGTTGYKDKFDSDEFYKTCERWARQGAVVFVSEFSAPLHWWEIAQFPRAIAIRWDLKTSTDKVDKLFLVRAP